MANTGKISEEKYSVGEHNWGCFENTFKERDSAKGKVKMREVGVCMRVSIYRCMTAYQKGLYGFINPSIVPVSYLVHKATMKQLVISVLYVLSEILISEVFDNPLEKRYF